MTDDAAFAARIAEGYPEGLTGIIAHGGTRTAYILERQRFKPDPGQLDDFEDYTHYALDQYLRVAVDFFTLGGRYLIMPILAYQRFYEQGERYEQAIIHHTLQLTEDKVTAVYAQHQIDPYFFGIDTLLELPPDQPAHQLGARLQAFQDQWEYDPSRRKLLWEVAPIPLYSFWLAQETVPPDEQQALAATIHEADDMRAMYRTLYAHYARTSLGVDIPVPHFYVGTNRRGELKLRSMTPIALLAGGGFRMFFVPYPSLMMSREALRAIMEDLAFAAPTGAKAYDYSGRYTSEDAQREYQRIQALVNDPTTIAGMRRDLRRE